MTIRDIVSQGFSYALTCRSLWLFGFFVGAASGGGSNGGGGGGHLGAAGGTAAAGGFPDLPVTALALIAGLIVLAIAAGIVLRFVGEGALIEGIVRARQGGTMTTREGFRAGWAHWGVLLRIALLYFAATIGSVAVLAAPCAVALLTFGPWGGVLVGIPALLVAVPWLVTLYLVQAFAWRIAVLENRSAVDAMRKARLFLHGRLAHALKLIVATFIGTFAIGLVSVVALVPVVLLLAALASVLSLFPVIVLGCVVLVPGICVLTAVAGTFRSSVWTLGYVTEADA